MATSLVHLLFKSRMALGVASQGALGELLGSSRHTGQRWEREQSRPSQEQLHRLATLVFPKDAQLAAELAASAGSTLQQLGLVASPPPQAPAVPVHPAPDPIHIVDTVVCAAAEAMRLMPDAVRPALRAAFRRARLAGLSIEAVEAALDASMPPAPASEGATSKA